MGAGKIFGVPTNMVALIVARDHDAFLPHARAARRAYHGGRLEPQGGASCRRQRQAGAVLRLCHLRPRSPRSPESSTPRGRTAPAPTPASAGRSMRSPPSCSAASALRADAAPSRARVMGAAIIFMLISGLVRTGASGNLDTAVIGIILLVGGRASTSSGSRTRARCFRRSMSRRAGSISRRRLRSRAAAARFSRRTTG